MVKIAPSIASAPMADLKSMIEKLMAVEVDIIHFDIEDGNFVPVMTLGTKLIQDLRPLTGLPFDVHLMVSNPEWLIPQMADMGVDSLSVHFEACQYPRRALNLITQHNMQAGLAFNPKTAIPSLLQYLPFLSYVVVLTTEPEPEYCSYLPSVLAKVRNGKERPGLESIQWMVDGGITPENIGEVAAAGADIIVSGRSVFKDGMIRQNIMALRKCLR